MSAKDVPVVDFHSHILPFVDHGSASLEMSEILLTQAKKAGVATIVATPHFYAHIHSVNEFLQKRDDGYQRLLSYLGEKSGVQIPIVLAAEVAIEPSLRDIPDLKPLAIEGTDHILIEMPQYAKWQGWMIDFLYEIESRHGLRVILAHVDRYRDDQTEKLVDLGFTAQINATSLVKSKNRRKLKALCEEGLIHVIGSDAHDDKARNYKDIIAAKKKIGEDLLGYFYSNAVEILETKNTDKH